MSKYGNMIFGSAKNIHCKGSVYVHTQDCKVYSAL